MSVTRKEIYGFKKEVCTWLRKNGVQLEHLIIESHTAMDGYVICWNRASEDPVVFNRDEWGKYLSHWYVEIRKEDLQKLRKGVNTKVS